MSTDPNVLLRSLEAEVKAFVSRNEAKTANLGTQLDQLRAEMLRPDGGRGSGGGFKGGLAGWQTPGSRFAKDADMELLRKTNRLHYAFTDGLHPHMEQKTLVTSAALGFSTPGVLNAERIEPAITPLARRRLVVRDLLRSKPIQAGMVDWVKELVAPTQASPVTEGNTKPEAENTFAIASEKTRTLAVWIPCAKQVLDDMPELQRFIDEGLTFSLKSVEEWELLFGDGSGEHIHGLAHQAGLYVGTYSTAGDTRLDKLRKIKLELEMANEQCNAFVLNPVDWALVQLIKQETNGSNTGSYVCSDPLGGVLQVPTVWGAAVVATPVMPVGQFLAGDFQQAVVGDRMPATLDVSDSHGTYFTENKIAIRLEERISLAVLRTTSFLRGSF